MKCELCVKYTQKYIYIIFANLLIINYLSQFYTVKICIFIWK